MLGMSGVLSGMGMLLKRGGREGDLAMCRLRNRRLSGLWQYQLGSRVFLRYQVAIYVAMTRNYGY